MKPILTTMTILVMANVVLTAAPADIRQGVVAYWPLDSTDGATTPDEGPYGNALSLFNMDASNFAGAGMRGNAAAFNGIDEYLARTHDTAGASGLPIFNARYFTVMMWVNGDGNLQGDPPGSGQDRRVFSEGSDTSTSPLFTIGTDSAAAPGRTNVVDFYGRGDSGTVMFNHAKSTSQVFDGTWHHFAIVNADTNATVYVDGQLDATFSYVLSPTTMNIVALGAVLRATAGNYYNGSIDDVILWERPLEQSEIQEAMNNGLATPVPAFAPFIQGEPQGATVGLGETHTFSVSAGGTRPLSYQWSKGSDPIPGATDSTYTVSNAQATDSGSYSVEISNAQGMTTSAGAILTVVSDPAADLQSGLVSYWPLDVVADGMTPDVAGGNNMMLVNMDESNIVPGQRTNALSFDGVEEYTERAGGFPIYDNLTYSVAFWAKGPSLQANRQVYAESSTANTTPLFIIGADNGGDSASGNVLIRNDPAVGGVPVNNRNSTRQVFDDTWHHVVWVDNNGAAKLFIDGVRDETDYNYTRGQLTLTTTALGAIRRATVSLFFNGLIDEVATWNRALTYTEIQELITVGLEAPPAPTPPEITVQPQGATLLTGTMASPVPYTFSVSAVGTGPLHFQWLKDDVALLDETSSFLSIANVQPSDSGSYTVTITNRAGMVTSDAAVLLVSARPAPPTSLCIDINNRAAPADQTEPGFEPFELMGSGAVAGANTRVYGGVEFSIAGSNGTQIDSRRRATPTNDMVLTQQQIYRDFVFARGNAGDGLDIRLSFLKPNQTYNVTVWSFDSGSGGTRVSDWFANGDLVVEAYTFGGQTLPATDEDNQFSFAVTADESGAILIQSIRTVASMDAANATSFGSFLNAICIEEAGPELVITDFHIAGAQIDLTFETANPQYEHRIQEISELNGSDTWADLAGVAFDAASGNSITAHFAYPAGSSTFYRVVVFPPAPIFTDDFEAADNWTHGGTGDSWERGTPTTGPGSAHSGDNAWATGLSVPYENSTMQWLRSPAIDLTAVSAAKLEFWEFRDVEPLFAGNPVDWVTVNIKDAANPDGAVLAELTQDVGTQTQWTKRSFSLPPAALGKSIVVEFMLTSDDFQPNPQEGWFIDDVSVLSE